MDRLPFYELEELLDCLKELNEKEEEERKKREGASSSSLNFSSIARQARIPNLQNPKLPDFKI